MSASQQQGFSLTELLVAVSILAILAALALTNHCRQQENGYRRYAIQALRAIGSAEQLYAAEQPGALDQFAAAPPWSALRMDNPQRAGVPVSFDVTVTPPPGGTFTATAQRTGAVGRQITMDQDLGQDQALDTTAWPRNAGCL